MSWNLSGIGTIAGVRERIARAPVSESGQDAPAKAFILAVLDSYVEVVNGRPVPTIDVNGVQVRARGHHDRWASTLTIEIDGVRLIPDPDPEPDDASTDTEPASA